MAKNTKAYKYFFLILIAAAFVSAVVPVKSTYTLSNNYTVTIHGTSNLHGWDEKVGTVSGDGLINRNSDGSFDLEAINIKMDVYSIKSGESSVMDNKTYKALKADDHPEIIFTLSSPLNSIKATSTDDAISAKGNLTIAGVTKSVLMQVKVFMQEHNQLEFEGSQTVKMTDYGIDPPSALFGMLKTGDEITINFKISFIPALNQ